MNYIYKILLCLSIVFTVSFNINSKEINESVDGTSVKSFTTFEARSPNAVFIGGGPGAWDENIREKVWIIEDNGLFRMWFTGHRGNDQKSSKIGYATSTDGITWTRYHGNPVIDRPSQDQDMSVVKISNTSYHMYVERDDNYIDLFLSNNGINWTFYGNIKTDATSPVVWKNKSGWFMLYESMIGFSYAIHLATSKDGKAWIDSPYNPVLEEDRHTVPNSIIRHEGVYHLWYHKAIYRWSLWHATSVDLINWENRQMISPRFSAAFVFIDSSGSIRAYMWDLGRCLLFNGSRNYYLKFGVEEFPEYEPRYNQQWNPLGFINDILEKFYWYIWRWLLYLLK